MTRSWIVFCLLFSVVTAKSLTHVLPDFKPDISKGQIIYAASCSQCHSQTAFNQNEWKHSLTPASVVMNLSDSNHAQYIDLEDLWHVTAYTWTKSSSGQDIKHGEALVLEAKKRMEKDALWLLISRGQDLMNLQSRDWVLSHTQEDIHNLIVKLAGDDYSTLSESDQEALIDYIYASYFVWPEGWSSP